MLAIWFALSDKQCVRSNAILLITILLHQTVVIPNIGHHNSSYRMGVFVTKNRITFQDSN